MKGRISTWQSWAVSDWVVFKSSDAAELSLGPASQRGSAVPWYLDGFLFFAFGSRGVVHVSYFL